MFFFPPSTSDCWTEDLVQISPDGTRHASVLNDFKIEIRDTQTNAVKISLQCIDRISQIKWSPDSRHILAAMIDRNSVHVFTFPTKSTTPSARIDGGEMGIERAEWSPNSQFVLLYGQCGTRIDVFELRTSEIYGLEIVKNSKTGCAFSPSGDMFAYLSRDSGHDVVKICDAISWEKFTIVPIDTVNATHIKWSPDGKHIAIADCVIDYNMVIISLESVESIQSVKQYKAYEEQLGITNFEWSPNSQILAIGSGDEVVRVILAPDFNLLTELTHFPLSRPEKAVYFQEMSPGRYDKKDSLPDLIETNDSWISRLAFSPSGVYASTTCASAPNGIFIWDIKTLSLVAVYAQMSAVYDVQWSPVRDTLCACNNTDKLLLWTPSGHTVASAKEAATQISRISWRADGEGIVAYDQTAGTSAIGCSVQE